MEWNYAINCHSCRIISIYFMWGNSVLFDICELTLQNTEIQIYQHCKMKIFHALKYLVFCTMMSRCSQMCPIKKLHLVFAALLSANFVVACLYKSCTLQKLGNHESDFKNLKLYGPFLWIGFKCLKATATSRRQFTFYH